MSIFSSIGKALGGVAKAVGTVALNVGGGVIGDNHLGSDLFSSSSGNVPQAQPLIGAPQYIPATSPQTVQYAPSFLDQLKGLFLVASGNKPIQTEVSSSAFPSWLLPAGFIVLLLVLFGGRRR